MVRLIPVERKGRTVWIEDSPTVCPGGHEGRLAPTWAQCPTCGHMCRCWVCRAPGCEAVAVDDEHQHRL